MDVRHVPCKVTDAYSTHTCHLALAKEAAGLVRHMTDGL